MTVPFPRLTFLLGVLITSTARVLAQAPQLPPAIPKPALPDLDVTYLERTPKYPAGGDWKYSDDGLECTRVKENPSVKHWPGPNETVTFIAHIVNKGGAASTEVDYQWMMDGQVPAEAGWTGKLKALQPEEETTLEVKWKWSPDPHRIGIFVDPANTLYEICERNNFREDWTHAKAIMIRVHPSIAKAFDEHLNGIGSFSFEDWIQEHFRILNEMLAAARWPTTPDGCVERVRIDPFKVASTEEMNSVPANSAPYFADGGWQFHESPPWLAFALRCNFVSVRDDGLIHELTHQIGIIDNYNIETGGNWVDGTDPASPAIAIWFRARVASGLMGNDWPVDDAGQPMDPLYFRIGPDTHVMQGKGVGRTGYSELEAAALNELVHLRRGHFGLYLADLATHNCIRILDRAGAPVSGASVATFPQELPSRQIARQPRFSGTTDAKGIVDLGAHPFGDRISCIGHNALLFVRVDHPSLAAPEHRWLELPEFNIAYLHGKPETVVLDVKSGIGGPDAPKRPSYARAEPVGGSGDPAKANALVWEPSPAEDVAAYRIYTPSPGTYVCAGQSPMASRELAYGTLLKEVPASQHSLTLVLPEGAGEAFAVTAVDRKGRESADAATPAPSQIVAREGSGTVRLLPPAQGERNYGRSAVLTTGKGKANFFLARYLSAGDAPVTEVKQECLLRLSIRTKSAEPCVIAFREKELGWLAIRVAGTGGLPEGAKEVGALGPVSDGNGHDQSIDLKAILDKASGKTGPYMIGDVLFGHFAENAGPAEYELRDVVLRWR